MSDVELHTDEAHQVIAAELVACTLGQRSRPELRTDRAGVMAQLFRQLGVQFAALCRANVTARQDYTRAR